MNEEFCGSEKKLVELFARIHEFIRTRPFIAGTIVAVLVSANLAGSAVYSADSTITLSTAAIAIPLLSLFLYGEVRPVRAIFLRFTPLTR